MPGADFRRRHRHQPPTPTSTVDTRHRPSTPDINLRHPTSTSDTRRRHATSSTDARRRLPTDRQSIPDFRSVPAIPNPTLPKQGDTSPTTLDSHPTNTEVASRRPDIATTGTTRLPHKPDNTLHSYITGSRASPPSGEGPRPTMGNGVSADQGNLPAHGKRDVKSDQGAKRHDWSEQARPSTIVTSQPKPTPYRNITENGRKIRN